MANEEHVKILRQGVKVWNKWRRENPKVEVYLREADLSDADLSGANLSGADLYGADLREADLNWATLIDADLSGANLSGANLWEANLSGAQLDMANLSNANLKKANLHMADLSEANLSEAKLSFVKLMEATLSGANLSGANLSEANLSGADLSGTNLMNADLSEANLSGTFLRWAKLQGAVFYCATVDGGTRISDCEVDRDTNFELVGLGDIKIDSGTRQLLEYSIRKKLWGEWFGKGCLGKRIVKKLLVRPFWWMSKYGLSTKRIIASFFIISLSFAVVYATLLYFYPPGIIHDLAVESHEPFWHYLVLTILRPVYFSVVTMTTLGFGDIYAEKQSIMGHVLLTIQVLLGYVMLGALVTRFAVLFSAGGPAGKFVPMSKEELRELEDIRKKRRQDFEKQESEMLKAAKEKKDTEDKQK